MATYFCNVLRQISQTGCRRINEENSRRMLLGGPGGSKWGLAIAAENYH